MNVFEQAIRIELEGAAFYYDLAAKSVTDGMKAIFTMLAHDEEKHKSIFEAMRDNLGIPAFSSDVDTRASSLFNSYSEDDFLKEEDHIALYEKALTIELKSIELYSEQLKDIKDTQQQEALEKIIEEERRHYNLIDDIIIMVSRPKSWVEHAEFGVREEY